MKKFVMLSFVLFTLTNSCTKTSPTSPVDAVGASGSVAASSVGEGEVVGIISIADGGMCSEDDGVGGSEISAGGTGTGGVTGTIVDTGGTVIEVTGTGGVEIGTGGTGTRIRKHRTWIGKTGSGGSTGTVVLGVGGK